MLMIYKCLWAIVSKQARGRRVCVVNQIRVHSWYLSWNDRCVHINNDRNNGRIEHSVSAIYQCCAYSIITNHTTAWPLPPPSQLFDMRKIDTDFCEIRKKLYIHAHANGWVGDGVRALAHARTSNKWSDFNCFVSPSVNNTCSFCATFQCDAAQLNELDGTRVCTRTHRLPHSHHV